MTPNDPHGLGPLLERVRAGDSQARNELLGRLRPYLKVLVRSWLGSDLARQLIDSDVVQVSLTKIHQNLEAFRGADVPELLAWVERIAFNAAIDQKRKAGMPAPVDDSLLSQVSGREIPPDRALEQAEEHLRLAEALERLSGPRREVIHARLFEGLPYAVIASRMKASEGALRVLFARAVRQLHDELKETDG
jgi:RNA polymerase sigma-70 factor, ECF subfamily